MSQIFPETVAASSNGTPCFSKLLMAFRMSQENIYCIYTNRDCFDSFKSSHRLQAGGADVARGGGVAASGTLAERKAAHLSLRGCDGDSTRCRERLTPRRAPRRSGRAMQTSHRGCDGEMDLSTSGLLGGRTRSKSNGC